MKAINNILISVTIPAYKSRYLKECIESTLTQFDNVGNRYTNYEVVIVDDASPENLKQIIEEIKLDSNFSNCFDDTPNFPKVHYYRNEKNFGGYNVVGNWNQCLKYCKGKYMICMGDDDKLLPKCLYNYENSISNNELCNIFHTRLQFINDASNIIGFQESRPKWESIFSFLYHDVCLKRSNYIGDFLFSVNFLRSNGGFYFLPYAWGSDRITVVLAGLQNGIINCSQYGFQYRINNNSISESTKNLKDKMLALCKHYDFYKDFVEKQLINLNNKNEILIETDTKNEDFYYCSFVNNELNRFFDKQKADIICRDLTHNIFHLFYWLRNRKKFSYSFSVIIRAIVLIIPHKNALKRIVEVSKNE